MSEANLVIRFRCKHCGQKIRVPKIHAGKKGKCPKCKNIVVVPKIGETRPTAGQTKPSNSKISSKDSAIDPRLFDIPQKSQAVSQPVNQEKVPDRALEDLQKLEEKLGVQKIEPEPAAERKLPWLIDIFLYPASVPGLTILGILVGVPLLIDMLMRLLALSASRFPPMLVFVVLFAIVGFIIGIIIWLYAYWYFCECIRDSANGGLRAPETIANTPGIGEMFSQLVRVVGCLVFFFTPVLVYFIYTREIDAIFWSLLAYTVFFFPMGLLAAVMFDSFSALNPILIIGSIFSTFLQYCGLVLFFYAISALAVITKMVLSGGAIMPFVSKVIGIYLLMVGAHLLGRFYWKYQEKLNWEV